MQPLGNPFDESGLWLRCALHAHTTNSDGEMAPDMLVRHYEWAGFDVLAITDHRVRTAEPSTERLLVIPGSELNAQAGGPEHDAHVLALGIDVDPVVPDTEFGSLPDVVRWIGEHGGVAYLAHTYWSGLRTDQFEACDGLVGIEVYNPGCELEVGRGNAGRLGYPYGASILERNDDGAIVAARLERPRGTPYGRLEVADAGGRR